MPRTNTGNIINSANKDNFVLVRVVKGNDNFKTKFYQHSEKYTITSSNIFCYLYLFNRKCRMLSCTILNENIKKYLLQNNHELGRFYFPQIYKHGRLVHLKENISKYINVLNSSTVSSYIEDSTVSKKTGSYKSNPHEIGLLLYTKIRHSPTADLADINLIMTKLLCISQQSNDTLMKPMLEPV